VKDIPNAAYTNEIQLYRQQALASLTNGQGPLTVDMAKGLNYFPAKESFKIVAAYVPIKADSLTVIPTYSGKQNDYIEYGQLTFILEGEQHTLTAFKGIKSMRLPQYRNKIFIMFKDETNEISTYGGGRYIYIEESLIQNDKIELDFNKAFNPYCAYSDGYNCPIPPLENHLNVEIKAGEKLFNKI
jgi:uncharacterized protein (DUF1684 family)